LLMKKHTQGIQGKSSNLYISILPAIALISEVCICNKIIPI
jgi:hypothetical protein